jgi:hypothetical protein
LYVIFKPSVVFPDIRTVSAHIQPTDFNQLLLLTSSSVFQSAAAPGWTLKKPAQHQALFVSILNHHPTLPFNLTYAQAVTGNTNSKPKLSQLPLSK